jgi:hypothetical protein
MDAEARANFVCELHPGGGLYLVTKRDAVREARCLLRYRALSGSQFARVERELRASREPQAHWWPRGWQLIPDTGSVTEWSVLTALDLIAAAALIRSIQRRSA